MPEESVRYSEYNLGPYRPRPLGDYDSTYPYRYLDIVRFQGATYICIFLDNVDHVACVGVLPTGQDSSDTYWMCIGEKGEKGDTGDVYTPYVQVDNGTWDFSLGDKCYMPDGGMEESSIVINNVYDGCCGMIITKLDLVLPNNSYRSLDYNFCNLRRPTDLYFYTFTYAKMGDDFYYIWHRTVITNG